jgi:hypothetical protein
VKTKNYKIQIFALGYRGGITLSLHGAVDIDRINDKNKVRITYEEVA